MSSIQLVESLQEGTAKYRELATGILLQYADSEMAASAGYASLLHLAPHIHERLELSSISYEKLVLAERAYQLISQTGMNVEKYVSSHCWESRLHRDLNLGYRRASADKRVNALMFPIQSWEDLLIFTYLMAAMASLQLQDFSRSSFTPWAKLAANHIGIEDSHRDFAGTRIEKLSNDPSHKEQLLQSLRYWRPRVYACFGPADSERNQQYIELGLKSRRNEELSARWQSDIEAFFVALKLNR